MFDTSCEGEIAHRPSRIWPERSAAKPGSGTELRTAFGAEGRSAAPHSLDAIFDIWRLPLRSRARLLTNLHLWRGTVRAFERRDLHTWKHELATLEFLHSPPREKDGEMNRDVDWSEAADRTILAISGLGRK